MLCPDLIGREVEADALRARVARLAEGRGGVVVLVADAGTGKTRLAREALDAARAASLPVLSGRAVPGATPVAYRPLTEAFLAAFRSTPLPTVPSLAGFGTHLGRLVPEWRTEASDGADESPLLLGEGVVRLLAVHGEGRGALLLLEDLHWSDPETLEVVDHLAEALRSVPVLCLCTTRPGGAADDLVARLERRDPASIARLAPLDDDAVDRMVAACLSSAEIPDELATFVQQHSDGSPYLVEELLAGLVAAGEVRLEGDRWTASGRLRPTVPASLRDSIERRLAALDPTARRVLGAASLLGRRFDWELLPGIAEVDGRAVVDALRAGVDEQLIAVEGNGFAFRHALTRETVAGELLPPERRELAARAWPAIERANPGLPGPTCELAADLAEAAGAPTAAAARLVDSAERALANGALATAEATARRARTLAEGDDDVAIDADELLVRVLAIAGNTSAAQTLGRALLARLLAADAPAARRVDLLLAMARAALTAGDLDAATEHTAAADAAAGSTPDLRARVDTIAAAIALDEANLGDAERLSRLAIEEATATTQPETRCEALLVLGRVVRARNVDDSEPWFEQAATLAAECGLPSWHLRAQQELAISRWPRGDIDALRDTRDLARRYGAMVTVAVMELSLADIALSNFDRDVTFAEARACVDASERYGLATATVAHLWLAGAHALRSDDEAMQAEIDRALAPDPDDPRILGDLYGRVLTTRAFVVDELETLPHILDTMIPHVRRAPPTTSVFPGRVMWALLHTIDDDDLGAGPRAELDEAVSRLGIGFHHLRDIVAAVARGREGDRAGADALVGPAYDAMGAAAVGRGMLHAHALLVAPAARRDGWGEPVRWLRNAEAFFAAAGLDRLARRCRIELGEAGAPMPRRGRGDSEVTESLRAIGVTSREVDVLKLVAAGRTNKEIAAELHLSPKTVERHLSSLFDKAGVRNRQDLADHLGVLDR